MPSSLREPACEGEARAPHWSGCRLNCTDEAPVRAASVARRIGSAGCSTVSFMHGRAVNLSVILDTVAGTVRMAALHHRGMPDAIVQHTKPMWDKTIVEAGVNIRPSEATGRLPSFINTSSGAAVRLGPEKRVALMRLGWVTLRRTMSRRQRRNRRGKGACAHAAVVTPRGDLDGHAGGVKCRGGTPSARRGPIGRHRSASGGPA